MRGMRSLAKRLGRTPADAGNGLVPDPLKSDRQRLVELMEWSDLDSPRDLERRAEEARQIRQRQAAERGRT